MSNTEVEIVAQPPAIPHKYDIIPIHASDIAAFMRCRRYWDWTSPARNNLRRKVQIYGISPAPWFGTGIHYALEMYYDPILRRDPVEAFTTWFTLQWEGGIIQKDYLDRTYDLNPVVLDKDNWRIEGLRDLLPDPDEEEFMGYRDLGIGMMEFYKGYSAREDNFTVIAAESQFSIPLGFEWTDIREQSPNYGKKLEVHLRGKRDMVYQHNELLHYGIMDYKTKTKIDDDYRESLNMDPQATTYAWASQEEARIYDLPYKEIHEVTHQAMRKVYPKPPTELKNGMPSVSRSEESTTADMFEQFIRERNLMPVFEASDKLQGYYTYLVESGDKQFIERNYILRNQYELAAMGNKLKAVAWDMLDDPTVYPTPSESFLCVHCALRAPCLARDDGSDFEHLLKDGYERNRDR
jgi:PD-(D/E)XK nuclease superfamily